MFGSWGPLVFEVSIDKVKTFDNLQRTESARWAKHELIGQKPKSEFLGPEQGILSFNMRFNALLGVNPQKELDVLARLVRVGATHTLVIGNKRHGMHKWSIKDIGQSYNTWDNRGNVLTAEVRVNMEEYL